MEYVIVIYKPRRNGGIVHLNAWMIVDCTNSPADENPERDFGNGGKKEKGFRGRCSDLWVMWFKATTALCGGWGVSLKTTKT